MKKVIELSRYLSLVAVILLLISSVLALFWGVTKGWKAFLVLFLEPENAASVSLFLIQVVDAILIAIVLFIFSVSIYELFIGDLSLPDWMIAHNLHELKSKLSSVIILVMAVRFLETLLEAVLPARDLLMTGSAIALMIFALIAFSYFIEKKS